MESTFFYGDLQVLWDVTFEVKEKEILVLVGANGAGKSTTLKTISSLLTPASGTIEFNGIRLDHLPPNKIIKQGIVHVPEGRRLFPEMSVEENLIMGSLYGEAKAKRNGTMDYVYSLFPRLEERRSQNGRHPVRRGTADAGRGAWIDVASEIDDVR